MSTLKVDNVILARGLDLKRTNTDTYQAIFTNASNVASVAFNLDANGFTFDRPKAFTSPAANDSSKLLATTEWIANRYSSADDTAGDAHITVKQPFAGAIVRTQHWRNAEYISVIDFGAIGDGTLHTVQYWVTSGRYPNLAAIQADYPHVTSLDYSIDAAALLAANNAANRSGSPIHITNVLLHVPESIMVTASVSIAHTQVFTRNSNIEFASTTEVNPIWWGHVVDPMTPYPYPNVPFDALKGTNNERFSLGLAKVLSYTDYPNFRLNDRIKNAIMAGYVNVTIVGDSITAGADNWRSNTYITLLQSKLKNTFPWVKFKFSNLAIGGMNSATLNADSYVGAASRTDFRISQNFWYARNNGGINDNDTIAPTGYALLDEDYWVNGSVAGKTWKQHVTDTNPDLIVYAFGMNDSTNIQNFNAQYDAFQTYVKTQLPAAPWFVLVSCFLPDKNPPGGQPHATWQKPAQSMADQIKHLSARDSYGLIDANSIFNFLRDGLRLDYQTYTNEPNLRYANDATKWSYQNGFTYNATSSRIEGSGMALRNIDTRDLNFSATFVNQGFVGGAFVARISYRGEDRNVGASDGFYSADIVMRPDSTIAGATLYFGNIIIQTGEFNMGGFPTVGGSFSTKVKVTGSRHELWLNDILMIDFFDTRSMYNGAVQLGIPQGSGYVHQTSLSYTDNNVETKSHFDRKWLLGTPMYDTNGNFQAYGDFLSNPDSLGGNVVNHPTAWGHNTYYGFGVMKFVNEFKYAVNSQCNKRYEHSNVEWIAASSANTPQVINTITGITIINRITTKYIVEIDIGYSTSGLTSEPQIGIFANNDWHSQYVPYGNDTSLRRMIIKIPLTINSGVNTLIRLGATKSSTDGEYRIGYKNSIYSITLKEV